ncbi:MAG: glycosyltransferase [Deltaproteobacteria bacterium]|nr:glycosyltransferase [Deltaproteobacteria bacterium]
MRSHAAKTVSFLPATAGKKRKRDKAILDAKNTPLVTVYITNHNYGRFIDQAIQSVLRQTLQDLELIIIDDGSTDNSAEIIERYADHEKVITILQHHKGLNVTNNIALRASHGKYIMRLDADDYLDENALMVLSGFLERNPNVGLVFPDYFLVDEDGEVLEVMRRHNFSEVSLLDQPAHGACTLIRREHLLELRGYDESFHSQDGYDLWTRFIRHYNVQNVNLPLFYYRQHPRSLTCNEMHILETRVRIIEKQVQCNSQPLSTIAIIPVRGPSVDPESPALRCLGGRALIDWTIQTALEAKRLSAVVITTPDEELIAYVSRTYGERVFVVKRDRKLALPNTYIEDTLFHALGEYTRQRSAPDAFVLLYIESPFRTSWHIDNAINVMELFDTDMVVAVRPDADVFYRHSGAGLEILRKGRMLRLEREELYREVGQMRVVKRKLLETQRQLSGGKVGHAVLDQNAALRLRSEWDWEVAELLASKSARKA